MSKSISKSNIQHVVIPSDSLLASCVEHHVTALLGASISLYGTLAEAAKAAKGARILVACVDPTEALARHLAEADTAAQAIADWTAEVSPLLAAARRVRRQLVLVDARALLLNDPDVLTVLGVAHDKALDLAGGQDSVPPLPDLAMLVLADALLVHDVQARRLAEEIASLRHGPGGAELDMAQLDAVHKEYTALSQEIDLFSENAVQQNAHHDRTVSDAAAVHDLVTSENDLLRENIMQQGTRHDRTVSDAAAAYATLSNENKKLREDSVQQGVRHDRTVFEAAAAHALLTGENKTLREDIVQQGARHDRKSAEAAAAHAALTGENKKLREDIVQQGALLEELTHENTLLRENVAEQIVGVESLLAQQSKLLAERDRLHKLGADRHVLKAQSDALQRRIEDQRARSGLREAVLGAVALQDQTELRGAMTRIEGAEAKARQLAEEVSLLQGELDGVYGSKSWRVTGPLRSVRSRGK